jgi:hypothetical protein
LETGILSPFTVRRLREEPPALLKMVKEEEKIFSGSK